MTLYLESPLRTVKHCHCWPDKGFKTLEAELGSETLFIGTTLSIATAG